VCVILMHLENINDLDMVPLLNHMVLPFGV